MESEQSTGCTVRGFLLVPSFFFFFLSPLVLLLLHVQSEEGYQLIRSYLSWFVGQVFKSPSRSWAWSTASSLFKCLGRLENVSVYVHRRQ
jgi:hypothetical protein